MHLTKASQTVSQTNLQTRNMLMMLLWQPCQSHQLDLPRSVFIMPSKLEHLSWNIQVGTSKLEHPSWNTSAKFERSDLRRFSEFVDINQKRKKYPLTLGQLHKQGRTERIKDFDLLESCHRDWFQSSNSHVRLLLALQNRIYTLPIVITGFLF